MVDIYYTDTSALLKRYVQEIGSDWLIALIAPERYSMVIASKLTLAEMASAFARRRRERTVTDDIYREVTQAFLDDCRTQYQLGGCGRSHHCPGAGSVRPSPVACL